MFTTEKVYKYSVFRLSESGPNQFKSIPTMADQKTTITFLAPSYLLYAVPFGHSVATAVFTNFTTPSPTVTEVQLGRNNFIEVGGGPIGGPTLTGIKVQNGELIFSYVPEAGAAFKAGPDARAVFEPVLGSEGVYDLWVFYDGKTQVVRFEKA
jgi:hypothetical protein